MPGSVIVSSARTPIGRLSGALSSLSAADLGGHAIKAALARGGVSPDQVDYVYVGQVIQAGSGQMPARQAAVKGGISLDVPSIGLNKACLSGIDAVYLADLMIQAGDADVVVAAGMESMTRAPYLLKDARAGYRMGNGALLDSMPAATTTSASPAWIMRSAR
jgi:acetyl-CoA C-acetyltransferase